MCLSEGPPHKLIFTFLEKEISPSLAFTWAESADKPKINTMKPLHRTQGSSVQTTASEGVNSEIVTEIRVARICDRKEKSAALSQCSVLLVRDSSSSGKKEFSCSGVCVTVTNVLPSCFSEVKQNPVSVSCVPLELVC